MHSLPSLIIIVISVLFKMSRGVTTHQPLLENAKVKHSFMLTFGNKTWDFIASINSILKTLENPNKAKI